MQAFVTTRATFLSSHTRTSTNNWFLDLSRLYLAWKTKRAVQLASFLVLYRLGLWRDSSLIFCPIALIFTPFNSTKTLFSYSMHYNKLHGRTRKLGTIKETGKTRIWPYLRATKWRWDWTLDVLSQFLHTLVLTCNWSIPLSPLLLQCNMFSYLRLCRNKKEFVPSRLPHYWTNCREASERPRRRRYAKLHLFSL